jgi:hypothetical protein
MEIPALDGHHVKDMSDRDARKWSGVLFLRLTDRATVLHPISCAFIASPVGGLGGFSTMALIFQLGRMVRSFRSEHALVQTAPPHEPQSNRKSDGPIFTQYEGRN